jgi:pSer/pThr/pTyr-binding forkhead associated (FHA) protein
MGKADSNVDYAICGNESISGVHATIVFEQDNAYIIDNNSTNKTYVEGTVAEPFEKTEIDNGFIFALGNEIFQIYMEAR